MPDNIWGRRFIQRGDKPAWHNKGFLIGEQGLTAEEMLNMAGNFEVSLAPLTAWVPIKTPTGMKGGRMTTDFCQIVRHPTEDDPFPRFFGSPVHKSYELISPQTAARLWDAALHDIVSGQQIPTETLGVIKGGRELFISALVGHTRVKTDDVDMYLVLDSPMYSNNAAICVITCVRPVCENTLSLGIDTATSKMIVPHTPGATDKIQSWLRTMYMSHASILDQATDDLTLMASRTVKSKDATSLLAVVYPDPPVPQKDWQFGISYEEHMVKYEQKTSAIRYTRQLIMELFGGDGLGQDTLAAEGTVFGLYNAVSEFEDNRLGTNESRALGVTVGERANTVRRAYRHFLRFCHNWELN